MFYWRGSDGGFDIAITDRGGDGADVSGVDDDPCPFGSFNLARHVGDDPDGVERHRDDLCAALGIARESLVFMDQCHGADVAVIDGLEALPAAPPAVDVVVTTDRRLTLAVMVADCVPVLLHDDSAGVFGAVHAGRPGMVAGVVTAAVGAMRDLGARSIRAVVGPSVCGRCYEVPLDMREAARTVVPESSTVTWRGTPAIDVGAGVVSQLAANDIAVQWVPGCTREDPRLYSYRRDGRTGRFAGTIGGARHDD